MGSVSDLIAKDGPIVIVDSGGERPAVREELESAALVAAAGPAYVKGSNGLRPCTIADMRSAIGRLNQQQQKTHRGGFYDPETARLAARRSHSTRKKKTKK